MEYFLKWFRVRSSNVPFVNIIESLSGELGERRGKERCVVVGWGESGMWRMDGGRKEGKRLKERNDICSTLTHSHPLSTCSTKDMQRGNMEGARIHAENAIRQKNQATNYLRRGGGIRVEQIDEQAKHHRAPFGTRAPRLWWWRLLWCEGRWVQVRLRVCR